MKEYVLSSPLFTTKCLAVDCTNRLNQDCFKYGSGRWCMYHCSTSSTGPFLDPDSNPGLIRKSTTNLSATNTNNNKLSSLKRSTTSDVNTEMKNKLPKVVASANVDNTNNEGASKINIERSSVPRHTQTISHLKFGSESDKDDNDEFLPDDISSGSSAEHDDSDVSVVCVSKTTSYQNSNNTKIGNKSKIYDFFGNALVYTPISDDAEPPRSTEDDAESSNGPKQAKCARERRIAAVSFKKVKTSKSSGGQNKTDVRMSATCCFNEWDKKYKLAENGIRPFSSTDGNGNLIVSRNDLRCNICNVSVGKKLSTVKNHIFGAKNRNTKLRPEESNHAKNKKLKDQLQQNLNNTKHSYERKQHFILTDKSQGKQGDMLPTDVTANRHVVLRALMCAGIPVFLFSTDSELKLLLESAAKCSLPYTGLTRLVPDVRDNERKLVQKEIEGKKLAIIFDGTTDRAEVFCVVLRFVDDQQVIQHRCAALRFYESSFDGRQLCQVLNLILTTSKRSADGTAEEFSYKIPSDMIQYAVRDGASVNTSAVNNFSCSNIECKDIICLSHCFNVIGKRLTDQDTLSSLKEFIHTWSRLVKNSQVCRSTFNKLCSKQVKYLSYTRWFTTSEVVNQVLDQFSTVKEIITNDQIEDREDSRKVLVKMLAIDVTNTKAFTGEHLILLLAAVVVDIGNPIRDACYLLEGDGFLSPFAYDVVTNIEDKLKVIANFFQLETNRNCNVEEQMKNFLPKCHAQLQKITNGSEDSKKKAKFLQDVHTILKDVHSKFVYDMRYKLEPQMSFFKASRLCNIAFIIGNNDLTIDNELMGYEIFNLFAKNMDKYEMEIEFTKYKECINKYVQDKFENSIEQLKEKLDGQSLWEFWRTHKIQLPYWYEAAEHFALIATSSASVERVFSLYDNKFSDEQQSALEDLKEGAIMVQANYNFRKIVK